MNLDHATRLALREQVLIPHQFSTGQVISADGTLIGYRQTGFGPGLVFMHGGMRASHHYLRLAEALAARFTVYLPDRRGRGLSGPPGEDYTLEKELQDLSALLHQISAGLLLRDFRIFQKFGSLDHAK